jgi:hypothetical protein
MTAPEPGSSFKHPLEVTPADLDLSALRVHVKAMHAGQTVRGRKPPRSNADLCTWHWEIHYRLHLGHIHEGPWIRMVRDRHGRRSPIVTIKPRGYWTGELPVTRAELDRRFHDAHPSLGVHRDASGAILRGPSLPCGCPLDADCTGHHPGRLA